MRKGRIEQQTVAQVVRSIPEARSVLRSYGIDPTSRMTLMQAAAATSVLPDELLAVLEDKTQRLAKQQRTHHF